MIEIYFLQNKNGFIKIGQTTNLKQRLKAFKNANPENLNLLLSLPIEISDDLSEKTIHQKFKKYRYKGEWFKPNQEIYDFITSYGGKTQQEDIRKGTTNEFVQYLKKLVQNADNSFYVDKGEEIWFYPKKTLAEIYSTYGVSFPSKIGRFLVLNGYIEKTRKNGAPSAQKRIGKKNISFWVIKRAKIEESDTSLAKNE